MFIGRYRRIGVQIVTVTVMSFIAVAGAAAGWVFQGPAPDIVAGFGYTEVTGAVEIVVPHPTDPNRAYVGAASGGIWRTDNLTAVHPTWVPLTDDQVSLSITALAFDPGDATHNTLYAGFGYSTRGITHTGSNFGPLPGFLVKTTDGGSSWSRVPCPPVAFRSVQRLLPTGIPSKSGDVILVATYSGLYRTANGGKSWTQVQTGNVTDLIAVPMIPNTIFAAQATGVLRSTDGGETWSALPGSPMGSVVQLAISPTLDEMGRRWLFAGVLGERIHYSNDNGNSWATMDSYPDGSHALGTVEGTTQLVVDPSNPRQVFAAGDGSSWFRGNAGAAPGAQWFVLTGAHTGNTNPHGDIRCMTFGTDPTVLYESDDGGIYRLRNATSNAPVWESAIGSLGVAEFTSVAYDSVHNTVFGSVWDNAIPRQTTPNDPVWTVNERLYGDGQQVGVDNGTPGVSVHYSSQQYLFAAQRQVIGGSTTTTDLGLDIAVGGGNYLHYNFLEGNIDPTNNNDLGTIRFDQTFVVNKVNGSRLVIGTDYLYESFDRGDHFTSLGGIGTNVNNQPIPLNPVGRVTSYYYGHPLDADMLVVGTYGQQSLWLRRNSSGYPTPVTTYPAAAPIDIGVDPRDPNRIFVLLDSGNVYRTVDGGATAAGWKGITASSGPPSSDVHALEIIPPQSGIGPATIVVGGYGGVFAAEDADDVHWWRIGDVNGGGTFPNTIVADLSYDASQDVLVAGTYGRGAWSLANAATAVAAPPCGTGPRLGCQAAAAGKSSLGFTATGAKASLKWKWASSTPVDVTDFGFPDLGTTYALCVYDASGAPSARASALLRPGLFTWTSKGPKYLYKDKSARPDGVTAAQLQAGKIGKESVKGKGGNLPLPTGVLTPPVTVQLLRSDGGFCSTAVFSAPAANDGTKFKAKSD